MNKFLKTKDNRIYVFKATERYSLHSSKMVDRYQELGTGHVCAYGQHILNKNNIDKESNAIEELCDEFICIHKERDNKTVHKSYWFAIAVKEECKEIYGSIWTESGLRYICKLSDDDIFIPFTK